MFKEGEYIIYKRDLCKIKKIEKDYYCLSMIRDESLSIKVPISNKLNYLRYPMSKQEANALISEIKNIEPIKTTDKLLETTYKELMKTNDPKDLIKIIKTTYLRNQARINSRKKVGDKDLTFFNQAENLLYDELSYSLNMSYEDCKNYIINNLTNDKELGANNV